MKRLFILSFFLHLFTWSALLPFPEALSSEKSMLTGKVSDSSGRPVEGAMVFVYISPSVKRSADFMSAPSEDSGLYRVFLPPGRYWAVARVKKAGGVGPLMPGDKHSGAPVEVDLTPGGEAVVDFVVADLKEAMGMREKPREDSVRITGRIIDEKGAPLVGVYATACRSREAAGIPDYLSAWVDDDGRYTLYVPKGKYFLGSAIEFPPRESYADGGEIAADADKDGVNIVRRSAGKR